MSASVVADAATEILVAAARTARRTRRPVTAPAPDPLQRRVYLPDGGWFEVATTTDLHDATAVLAVAGARLSAGDLDAARAALAYLDVTGAPMSEPQAAHAAAMHAETHPARCCTRHATHADPHKGCILR